MAAMPQAREAYIGLGANLGEPAAQIEYGLRRIAKLPGAARFRRSSLYRSDPVGPGEQPDYCNAVCSIETPLTPAALLEALLAIERDAGRARDGVRWGPRRLDLDLLHIVGFTSDHVSLTLPHPHLAARNWVLVPLTEIAPTLEIPGLGLVSVLAERLGNEGLRRWF
jgi:2-amino-4-hydroxy-6-hydroxymethyldihydropteridine diphosphokinase